MSMNGYDGAFDQATNERAEIRIEIERLLTRGELLDKLLECLAPFVTSPKAVADSGHTRDPIPSQHMEEHHAPEHQEHHEYHEHHQG
jgi:hypothetical protein